MINIGQGSHTSYRLGADAKSAAGRRAVHADSARHGRHPASDTSGCCRRSDRASAWTALLRRRHACAGNAAGSLCVCLLCSCQQQSGTRLPPLADTDRSSMVGDTAATVLSEHGHSACCKLVFLLHARRSTMLLDVRQSCSAPPQPPTITASYDRQHQCCTHQGALRYCITRYELPVNRDGQVSECYCQAASNARHQNASRGGTPTLC